MGRKEQKEQHIQNLMDIYDFDYATSEHIISVYIEQGNMFLVDINTSLQKEMYSDAKKILHQFKGASGSAAIEEMVDKTTEAEKALIEGDVSKAKCRIKEMMELELFHM